jgi:hypothetical protein
MTPDVEPRRDAGPGRNGRSTEDPEIHDEADEEPLQFGTYNDIVEHEMRPEAAHIEPPRHQEGLLNAVKVLRTHAKKKRVAQKGYVQWYLIDGGWPAPRMVRPEQKGGGVPELEHDGNRYLFPKQAMLPSDREGAWTVVHRKGEADPLPLRQRRPGEAPALSGDAVDDVITRRVTTSAPGWLSDLNLSAEAIMTYLIVAFVGLAMAYAFLGGGGLV